MSQEKIKETPYVSGKNKRDTYVPDQNKRDTLYLRTK
jgi:hypothetical protein